MRNNYEEKLGSMEEATEFVESGDRIWTPLGLDEPSKELMDSIADRKDELEDVEYLTALPFKFYDIFEPEYRDTFNVGVGYHSPITREKIANSEWSNFVPWQGSDMIRKVEERDRVDPRRGGLITQVTPPDKHGYVNIGLDAFYTKASLEVADYAIGEVNDQIPRTYGDTSIHVSEFDAFVENSSQLTTYSIPEAGDVEKKIAENVVSLINDQDCLQVGIGQVPDVMCKLLVESGLEDLGMHTEMVPGAIPELVSEEVVTCEYKNLHSDKILLSFVVGEQDLYDWLEENPLCEFRSTRYINNVSVLSKIENLVAINGCLEVDLTGQVCSESLGNTMFSGTGGQLDFVVGSFWSDGGRSINICPSTAQDGEKSRIVPHLCKGSRVTVPRQYTGYVVTEYGVADLYGLSEPERAQALIDIAHPKFREELEEKARERGLLR